MNKMLVSFCLIAFAFVSMVQAQVIPGNAKRGAELLQNQRCLECHSIRGKGGTVAPDLGKIMNRAFTPSGFTTILWNHAPTMWAEMEKRQISRPQLTEEDISDIFAYFHSVRFFEQLGDAGRGKQAFQSKRCYECHGLSSQIPGGGPPVDTWGLVTSPIAMAQQMWNHSRLMREAMATKKIRWPSLTSQELTDLLVYLRNLPGSAVEEVEFSLTAGANGEALFQSKGCVNCHTGKLSLQTRATGGTLTDFAVAMWNHAPKMWQYGQEKGASPPQLEKDEMRDIVSYLWYTQIFVETGNAGQGRRVFERKKCATCHLDPKSGAPDLKTVLNAKNPLTPISMAAVLWQHGPSMLTTMKSMNIGWPSFGRSDLIDLIAYLNGSEFRTRAAN